MEHTMTKKEYQQIRKESDNANFRANKIGTNARQISHKVPRRNQK